MHELTEAQEIAMNSRGKVVLKACPGSGKTFVVASKFLNMIGQWEHRNKGVALISFTNIAYDEVLRQMEEISGARSFGYPHFIGTIDSFIFNWLFAPFGHLVMGCSQRPSILLESSKILNIAAFFGPCIKNGCHPLDFYYDIHGDLKTENKRIGKCPITKNRPCERFARYCYSKGVASYLGITSITYRILDEYPNIARILTRRFPMLIIDEAQDTSLLQMRIIEKLVENGLEEVTLIGDPDQAIYEFREADPSVFMDKHQHPNWNGQTLMENFRCSQNICNATRVFSTLDEPALACGDTGSEDFKPCVWKYSNKEKIIDDFLSICTQNDIEITPENVAVLVRGRTGLFGKDYRQINNLWQSRVVWLLSKACYERDYGMVKIAKSLVEEALFELFIDSAKSMESDYLLDVEKVISISLWKRLVMDVIKALPSADTPLSEWIETLHVDMIAIQEKYGLALLPTGYLKIKTRDKRCPDFKTQPLKCFFAQLNRDTFLNATIHAVKGRTFEAVLLFVSARGNLTSNKINKEDIESEPIRTAYVAMTRAKRLLVIAIPATVKNNTLVRFSEEHWNIDTEAR